MINYNPADWFWVVAGDQSRAWSSKTMAYVSTWDAERTTRIASEDELWEVLQNAGVMKTKIYKANIWMAATDSEAEVIDLTLSAQSVRLRRLWAEAQYLDTRSDLFPVIKAAFARQFGEARAIELLTPTE
jgi:hypothetical protein